MLQLLPLSCDYLISSTSASTSAVTVPETASWCYTHAFKRLKRPARVPECAVRLRITLALLQDRVTAGASALWPVDRPGTNNTVWNIWFVPFHKPSPAPSLSLAPSFSCIALLALTPPKPSQRPRGCDAAILPPPHFPPTVKRFVFSILLTAIKTWRCYYFWITPSGIME